MAPLQAKLEGVLRQWVLALQRAAAADGWTRGERQALAEILASVANEPPAEFVEDIVEAVADHEEPARPAGAARQRREAAAQQATQSLRQVFRKLASALHPDREPDGAERARKTALMAQVNEAYGREDLLALLELQLRIEQIDAEHLANVDAVRLKHYNKVLAEQLAELREEIANVEAECRRDFGLEADAVLDPKRLQKELEAEAARLRKAVAQLRQEVGAFADLAWTRRWLRAQRP